MKSFARTVVLYALALFIVSTFASGLRVDGGIATYVLAGLLFTIMNIVIRPILNIITLPLFFLSFGKVAPIQNTILLYLLTIFVSEISVSRFTFTGANVLGFLLPKISFNTFFAYIVIASAVSIVVLLIQWLAED